jgi:hypothetical protein
MRGVRGPGGREEARGRDAREPGDGGRDARGPDARGPDARGPDAGAGRAGAGTRGTRGARGSRTGGMRGRCWDSGEPVNYRGVPVTVEPGV